MKKFIILGFGLVSLSINANEKSSLNQFMVDNFDWKQDSANIVHVGTRCATLMNSIVLRLSEDNRGEVKSLADKYKNISDVYMFSTTSVAKKINYSTDGYTKLYKTWVNNYQLMAKENAIKYNNFLHGMIGEDFKTCGKNHNVSFYQSMIERSAKK